MSDTEFSLESLPTFAGEVFRTRSTLHLAPKTASDVSVAARILKQARATGLPATFRARSPDLYSGLVLDMHQLDPPAVNLEEGKLVASAGATAKAFADNMSSLGSFVPIDSALDRSVASTILRKRPGQLPRSVGKPHEILSLVHIAKAEGDIPEAHHPVTKATFEDGPVSNSIISRLEFKSQDANKLWVSRLCQPFTSTAYIHTVQTMFRESPVPGDVDLMVRVATSGSYTQLRFLIVTIAGLNDTQRPLGVREEILGKLVSVATVTDQDTLRVPGHELSQDELTAELEKVRVFGHYEGSSAVEALADIKLPGSAGRQEHDGPCHALCKTVRRDGFAVEDFCARIEATLEMGTADIQLLVEDELFLDLHVFSTKHCFQDFGLDLQDQTLLVPTTEAMAAVDHQIFEKLTNHFISSVPTVEGLEGFGGLVCGPQTNPAMYVRGAKPYAASSYDPADSSPHLVLYPVNEDDIKIALKYAEAKYRVVVQSGGHQYSGKSTGPSDTIVLMMSEPAGFANKPRVDLDDNGRPKLMVVQAGVNLQVISKELIAHEASIPHGECPSVCVGGHAQTGGFGHMMRSYGLMLDYVQAFSAVLADGRAYRVVRPDLWDEANDQLPPKELNDSLFGGVLGGGPGSFAVVTEYELELINDADHPHSWGASIPMLYEKNAFTAALNVMANWTAGDAVRPPADANLFLTVVTAEFFYFKRGFMLTELLFGDIAGDGSAEMGKKAVDDAYEVIQSSMSLSSRVASAVYELFSEHSYARKIRLSKAAHVGVRNMRKSVCGPAEDVRIYREFDNKYTKRVNGFTSPMSPQFVTQFATLVSETLTTPGINLVVQMLVGGGKLGEPAPGTRLPHRDVKWGLVYDIFYEAGYERTAEVLQEKMKAIITTTMPQEKDSIRLFWGSYDDTNMDHADVVRYYYGANSSLYREMQKLKSIVDGDDLFRTSFTVRRQSPQSRPATDSGFGAHD